MNLNEECLLQFLRNEMAAGPEASTPAASGLSDAPPLQRRGIYASSPTSIRHPANEQA